MEYKVLIDWSSITKEEVTENPLEKEQIAIKETSQQPKEPTVVQSNDMLKSIKTATVVYAYGRQIGQATTDYYAQNYSISGDTLKAERLQTRFSNTANNVGLGLGIGLSVATGNPLVIATTAYSLAQKAYNLALSTRQYMADLAVERYTSQYYSNRLVKDISEVR